MNMQEAMMEVIKAKTVDEAMMSMSELQDVLGVTDGGVAGLHFSHIDFNLHDLDCAWYKTWSDSEKFECLKEYISMELLYLDL